MPPSAITARIQADDATDDDPVWMVDVDLSGHQFTLDGSWETVGAAVDAVTKWASDRAYTLAWPTEISFVPLENVRGPG